MVVSRDRRGCRSASVEERYCGRTPRSMTIAARLKLAVPFDLNPNRALMRPRGGSRETEAAPRRQTRRYDSNMSGKVESVNTSRGGVPKSSVFEALVTE